MKSDSELPPIDQQMKDTKTNKFWIFQYPIGSMYYLPTFTWCFMVNVGKYTSPMDPMGILVHHPSLQAAYNRLTVRLEHLLMHLRCCEDWKSTVDLRKVVGLIQRLRKLKAAYPKWLEKVVHFRYGHWYLCKISGGYIIPGLCLVMSKCGCLFPY